MPKQSSWRSPLGMVILAFLAEEPTHAYRLHELIRLRGKDSVVNVAQRNSVYQVLGKLLRDGLIRVQQTARGERTPDRVIHEVTPQGKKALHAWLQAALSDTAPTFPQVVAALSLIMLLPPRTAHTRLRMRRDELGRQLEDVKKVSSAAKKSGVHRLFLLEDGYRMALLAAELDWLDATLRQLKSGGLTWNKAWLEDLARADRG